MAITSDRIIVTSVGAAACMYDHSMETISYTLYCKDIRDSDRRAKLLLSLGRSIIVESANSDKKACLR